MLLAMIRQGLPPPSQHQHHTLSLLLACFMFLPSSGEGWLSLPLPLYLIAVLRNIELKVFEQMFSCPSCITLLSPLASCWRLHLSEHRCSSCIPVASTESQLYQKRYIHFSVMAQSL